MTKQTYFLGLIKDGNRLVVQAARDRDQLSCELWKYYGERIITIDALKERKAALLAAVNAEFSTTFARVSVRKVADSNYTAGH